MLRGTTIQNQSESQVAKGAWMPVAVLAGALVALVATFELSDSMAAYEATVPTGVDADDVVVAFVNGNVKRAVTVDNIVLDGTVYETEDPAVLALGSPNPASDCKQGYLGSEELSCRSQLVFPTSSNSLLSDSADQTPTDTWATHCGDITGNETWSSSIVHVVDCPVNVTDGARLTTALLVKAGQVRFRGDIIDTEQGIRSCDNGCIVDAQYTDWGNPAGPYNDAGEPLACGQVLIGHWIGSTTWDPNTQQVTGNCDGSPLG